MYEIVQIFDFISRIVILYEKKLIFFFSFYLFSRKCIKLLKYLFLVQELVILCEIFFFDFFLFHLFSKSVLKFSNICF